MTFYQKYVSLCTNCKVSPSAAAQKMGISKTAVHRWKNGGGVTDAYLQIIANYFGVSVDALREDAENEKKPTAQGDELTKEDVEEWIKTEATDEELIQFIAAASAKLVKK
mgnify:CR=1 FL=1